MQSDATAAASWHLFGDVAMSARAESDGGDRRQHPLWADRLALCCGAGLYLCPVIRVFCSIVTCLSASRYCEVIGKIV